MAGISLKALGADPLVRDIFVEVDYMAMPAGMTDSLTDTSSNSYSLNLQKDALIKVKAAFESYQPDENDSNQFPIRIHLDIGDRFDQAIGINSGDFDLGGGNEIPFYRCIYLGTDATHTQQNCANLYNLKKEHFDPARQLIFHYFIFAWSQNNDGSSGPSGIAELDGNDGIISVGSYGGSSLIKNRVVNYQAATLFHELGHNLGLSHGGNEASNYKPNYVSSMNYFYQLTGIDHDHNGDVFYYRIGNHPKDPGAAGLDFNQDSTLFSIDYSYGSSAVLAEISLDESIGWRDIPIDFNANNNFDQNMVSANVQPISYNSSSNDVHNDFDDWKNLKLDFQSQHRSHWTLISTDRQPISKPCVSLIE